MLQRVRSTFTRKPVECPKRAEVESLSVSVLKKQLERFPLKIDPETRAVIAHTVPEKPKPIEDLAAEVAKLKGAGARREEL